MMYYNEYNPYCVRWLQNLRDKQYIPTGVIDQSDIKNVKAKDVSKISHFFAGLGGWPLALALAEWPKDQEVWTGSCPCQPFSTAGKGKGIDDERHLWPIWLSLINECRPATIFGEQVASPLGREWLAGVRADLEGLGYAVGAADLCAASVGAPQIRQRLWWVGHTSGGQDRQPRSGPKSQEPVRGSGLSFWSDFGILPCTDRKARRVESGTYPLAHGVSNRMGRLRAYGNAIVPQVAAEFIKAYMDTIVER